MNGQPLGRDHGAPFRLIVPHWYAVASVKWLKRLDVLTEPYTGEFQTGHYIYQWPDRPHEPVTLMRVRARITDPAPGSILDVGTYTVRGKAWSGTGPIARVDVSLTGEGDWQPAQLEPARGDHQWQDWSFTWDSINVGRHTLRARATDAAGNVQPDVPPWNRLGYGNNAIEVIYVDRRCSSQETTWTCSRSTRPAPASRGSGRPTPCPGRRPRPEQLRRVRARGRRITVRVPDEVDLKIEVEIGDDENELEIELTW